MLGVEAYGSDSDAGSGDEIVQPPPPAPKSSSLTSKLPAPAKKSSFSQLPPSTISSSKSSPGLPLPPPKAKKFKKIAIALPSLPKDVEEAKSDDDDRPAAKKLRLESGAGSSALLSMLPAPKNKASVPVAPERVLGGGRGPNLFFKTASSRPSRVTTVEDVEEDAEDAQPADIFKSPYSAILEEKKENTKPSPLPFMPTSVKRGKVNVSVEKYSMPVSGPAASSAQAVDFFSLCTSETLDLCYAHSTNETRSFIAVTSNRFLPSVRFDNATSIVRPWSLLFHRRTLNQRLQTTRTFARRRLPRILYAPFWSVGRL